MLTFDEYMDYIDRIHKKADEGDEDSGMLWDFLLVAAEALEETR